MTLLLARCVSCGPASQHPTWVLCKYADRGRQVANSHPGVRHDCCPNVSIRSRDRFAKSNSATWWTSYASSRRRATPGRGLKAFSPRWWSLPGWIVTAVPSLSKARSSTGHNTITLLMRQELVPMCFWTRISTTPRRSGPQHARERGQADVLNLCRLCTCRYMCDSTHDQTVRWWNVRDGICDRVEHVLGSLLTR